MLFSKLLRVNRTLISHHRDVIDMSKSNTHPSDCTVKTNQDSFTSKLMWLHLKDQNIQFKFGH